MSTTPKRAINGQVLTTSTATGYTVGTALKFVVHRLAFTNHHPAADAKVTAWLVPSGSTAKNANLVACNQLIRNDDTWICYAAEGQVLDAGGTIQFKADTASAVNAVCSGVEMDV